MTKGIQPASPNQTSIVKKALSPTKVIALAVVVGAIALLIIGLLAHFNVIHQIGSLSQQQIATGTALGAGTLGLGGGMYIAWQAAQIKELKMEAF